MIKHLSAVIGVLSRVPLLIAVSVVVLFSATLGASQERADSPARTGKALELRDFTFQHVVLRNAIDEAAHLIALNVAYHVSSLAIADNTDCDLALKDASAADAISALLRAYGLAFVQIDRRAIMIVKEGAGAGGSPFRTIHSVISKAESEEAEDNKKDDKDPKTLKARDVVFKSTTLLGSLEVLAQTSRLRIVFDPQVTAWANSISLTIELRNVTPAQALRYVLDSYDLKYEQVNWNTLNIVGKNHEHSSTPLEEIIRNLQ